MSESKPDCHKCKHREPIPGNAHISCHHPAFDEVWADPMLQFMALIGQCPRIVSKNINVVGNPAGIRMGYFAHPLNFDPVWLIECSGFELE